MQCPRLHDLVSLGSEMALHRGLPLRPLELLRQCQAREFTRPCPPASPSPARPPFACQYQGPVALRSGRLLGGPYF